MKPWLIVCFFTCVVAFGQGRHSSGTAFEKSNVPPPPLATSVSPTTPLPASTRTTAAPSETVVTEDSEENSGVISLRSAAKGRRSDDVIRVREMHPE